LLIDNFVVLNVAAAGRVIFFRWHSSSFLIVTSALFQFLTLFLNFRYFSSLW